MKTSIWAALQAGILLCAGGALAQEPASPAGQNQPAASTEASSGTTHFLLAGYGAAGWEKEGSDPSTFGPAFFAPIFLFKMTDKFFFESEIEISIEDGVTSFHMEFATLHYLLNDYLSVSVGKFNSPFGTFSERLEPVWIDKFSEKPLGLNDEKLGVGPLQEYGIEFRGGAPLGDMKVNYSAYVTNGPMLLTGDTTKGQTALVAGQLDYAHLDNLKDNNENKAVGGRVGLLPLSNSSLEIGLSGQFARVGADDDSAYKNIGAQLFAGDISYVAKVGMLRVDVKGQYNQVNVDKASYVDTTGKSASFDNTSSAYYAQLALRPAYVRNQIVKNIELAARYSAESLPKSSAWGGNQSQIGLGVNYWLSWNSVLKASYLLNKADGEADSNNYYVLLAFGI